ncbi:5340_t:CDS:2 [Funneliformis geosporum]|uniref:11183_t:CDS:1 n=1 Tax=Funneliformis geosporum TaxID=1117311 RepID=A0A9W4SGE0_9GLOM|nr:5340_t:CDS:2 [Funneliformis geosporum]CAI2168676.1 11183_t:CDS:2 [Funneliformis geosporum]
MGIPLFDRESDDIISDSMIALEKSSIKYKIIHEMLPQYTSRQIRQRYLNHLNWRLCKNPLGNEEKAFVIRWITTNQTQTGTIHWKQLILDLNAKFGLLRSENTVKNFWYSRMKQLSRAQARQNVSSAQTVVPFNNGGLAQYSKPVAMEPNFHLNPQMSEPYRMAPHF